MHDSEAIMMLQDRCDLLEKCLESAMVIIEAGDAGINAIMLDAWHKCQADLKGLNGEIQE